MALLKKLVEKEDDLLDLKDDMTDVKSFFKNQRTIYDKAEILQASMVKERDYFQADSEVNQTLSQINNILKQSKPYKSISQLPGLSQLLETKYDQQLDLKRKEVYADIQAAMAEIHQTANIHQKDIVDAADYALGSKKTTADAARDLTSLDAMKIQIGNIRQQYLKKLVVVEKPEVKESTISRNSICHFANLKSKEDIDEYIEEIRQKLIDELDGNDVIHII